MKTKQFTVRIKAAGTNEGTPDGVFEAIAATYDLDSVGDKIVPGAFSETLVDWAKSGDSIPLYWSHRMDDPHMNIGHVLDSRETVDGLWVKGQLDLETPTGMQVYRLLKGRRVGQMSFAYDVEEGAPVEKDGQAYYELRKLKLHEVSVVPVGANQNTEVLAVKHEQATVNVNVNGGGHDKTVADAVKKEMDRQAAATAEVAAKADQILADKDSTPDVKAGRSLSAKNEERVRDIARLAKELLDSVTAAAAAEAGSDDEGKTSTTTETSASSIDAKAPPVTQPATSEEPAGAKDATPARPGPASLRLLADLDAMCVEAY